MLFPNIVNSNLKYMILVNIQVIKFSVVEYYFDNKYLRNLLSSQTLKLNYSF